METKQKRTFEQWIAAVNAECLKRVGVSYLDLPDIDYAGMFEDRVSPRIAASRAIRGMME